MNQVIFASDKGYAIPFYCTFVPVSLVGMSVTDAAAEGTITDYPNEDFIITYTTSSKTIKTIEVNRETLSIQKINQFGTTNRGEYHYALSVPDEQSEEGAAVQIIRQDAVPHQRNSWYIELNGNTYDSFVKQLKVLSKSELLGITSFVEDRGGKIIDIYCKYPLTLKSLNNATITITEFTVTKSPYQYLQMLLTKHVQNFGYNHTDDNAELNSGLADYKAWIAGTEKDSTVAVYRLRFATNRKASKTRDERVWQNVYICTKGKNNSVASTLDAYIAILNGETTNNEGGEQ